MAIDNPSYFSLRNSDSGSRTFGSLFRRSNKSSKSSSSSSQQQQQLEEQQPSSLPPTLASSSASSSTITTTASNNGQIRCTPVMLTGKQHIPSTSHKGSGSGSSSNNAASGACQKNAQSPSSSDKKKGLKNLFRSASLIQDPEKAKKFLNGDPRPEDMAPPSPYLNERHMFGGGGGSVSRQTGRRCFGLSGGKKKEFAQNAAAPASPHVAGGASLSSFHSSGYTNSNNNNNNGNRALVEENDYYSYDRNSECGSEASTLPIDEIEPSRSYYNVPGTLNNLQGNGKFSSMSRLKKRQNAALQQRRRRRHSIGTYLDGVDDEGNLKPTTTTTTSQNAADDGVRPATKNGTRHHHNATSSHGNANARGQYASDNNNPTSNNNTNNNNNSGTSSSMDGRDDVVFVSCKDNEAAALWVNYLTACFEQISRQQGRPPFRLFQVSLEDTLTPNVELRIRASRLQIIIVCPVMMERVAERQDQAQQITRQFSSERVLAMMLGVQDAGLQPSHRSAFVAYPTWRKFFAKDQDEGFVGQFFGAAVAILGTGAAAANVNGQAKQEKIGFSVHPKKVKLGQNRILALLNEPLHPDDTVTVLVDRCGEALEVSHVKRRNPYTLQFSIPERCLDVSMLVGVRISRNGAPLGLRQIKCESRLRELDQILRAHDNPLEFMCQTFGFNPSDKEQLDNWMVHAFQKNVPPHFNLLSNPPGELNPVKNHASSEENPTLLHFSARFGLEKLAWQLLECPGADLACEMRNVNDLTPAEIAEQSGHARLANQLRGYMQMNEFTNMYSYLKIMSEGDAGSGATNGNGSELRRPMNEFLAAQDRHRATRHAKPSSMSQQRQLKQQQQQRSEDHHHHHNHQQQMDSRETSLSRQEDYCMPRPLSEAYSVPPAARPVTRHFPDYATPPPLPQPNKTSSAVSLSSASSVNNYGSNLTIDASNAEQQQQQQHNSIQGSFRSPDSAASTPTTLTSPSPLNGDAASSFHHNHHQHHHRLDSDQTSTRSSLARSSSSNSSSAGKSRDSPQDELLEIITDFKNNVFTIAEVERLVENWKNRNDVQQSFKDKQRQLAAMRDEYERIQKRMKDDLKMPTPFDRIRKFFTKGGKKDSKDSTATASSEEASPSKPSESNGNNVNGNNLADRRPVSSLSLHSVSSSSSSGRMSTVSGCSGASLGDSGTHSDTDERRLQHANGNDNASAAGMTNYEIPPAPKPYTARPHSRLTSTPSRSIVGELDVRPVKSSVPAMDDKEYYIAFPPSGLPVHSFKPNVSAAEVPKTPNCTPVDSVDTVDGPINMNYANLGPVCNPPVGMCIPPFEYVNVSLPGASSTLWEKPSQQQHQPNILTIQPEIHPEPSNLSNIEEMSNDENENVAEDSSSPLPQPDSPKILNTDNNNDTVGNVDVEQQQDARMDGASSLEPSSSSSSGVAASEEIAKNFGVTLKKSGPPVPPRSEFTFITTVLESRDE